MHRIFRRSVFIPILCIFAVWHISGGVSPAAGQKITKENGVEVIHNPKDPVPLKGVPSTPVLREDLVIGAESGDENYVFSDLGTIVVNDNGDIFALDRKAFKVRIFDAEGKFRGSFGKKGQGPGEWQIPYLMVGVPGGQIAVKDALNRKLYFYSPAGDYLREEQSLKSMTQRIAFDMSGLVYGNVLESGDKYTTDRLIKFDRAANPVAAIVEFKEPYRPRTLVPYGGDVTFFQVIKPNDLIWTRRGKYEFTVVDERGRTIRKITKDYAPLKISDQVKKDRIQKLFRGNVPEDVTVTFPEYFPPIRRFIADLEGRLFVQTYEKDEMGHDLYDVFSPQGRCVARFGLPSSEALEFARGGKLYCVIEENGNGIPQIKRYSLEWK